MKQQISWKVAAVVIAIVVAICAFVYSRLPTGMVVHTTGKMGSRGRPGPMGTPTLKAVAHQKAVTKAAAKLSGASAAPEKKAPTKTETKTP